jgi:putative transcriptional regulator
LTADGGSHGTDAIEARHRVVERETLLAAPSMRNRVRELRTAKGLSQGELAAHLDVSRQTINSIEQERYTPSLPLALALARFFETTVEEMFDADH